MIHPPHLAIPQIAPSTAFNRPERTLAVDSPLPSIPRLLTTPDEARRTPVETGHLSAKLMEHGSMQLRWYEPQTTQPDGQDPQVPHDRDELYVVVAGTGVFVCAEDTPPFGDDAAIALRGEQRVAVKPGDALFVPAGAIHRFEAISPDFGTWMIFYGPEGGEPA